MHPLPSSPPVAVAVPTWGAWSAGRAAGWTALVVLLGFAFAVLNTTLAYATLGVTQALPIGVGVVLCLAFSVAVRLLHRASWLSVLALVPALFVLVGSVQLAPEAALDRRGVRQDVVIVDEHTVGNQHTYTLRGADGPLAEPLRYSGSRPDYRVGDRLAVLTDPRGVVELADAGTVDPAGQVAALILGVGGWTLIALLAGWRGYARRRHGRHDEGLG